MLASFPFMILETVDTETPASRANSLDVYKRQDMDKAVCVPPMANEFPDVLSYSPMHEKTPNATVGDATVGTPEKGQKIFNICVDPVSYTHLIM